MKLTRAHLVQLVTTLIVHVLTLMLLAYIMPGFTYTTYRSIIFLAIIYGFIQSLFWWVFINFFSWLPVWLYPIVMFVMNGIFVAFIGNLFPGVTINGWGAGLFIVIGLTIVDAIFGSLLSLDEDGQFDRNVTRSMVNKRGKPTRTDVPGILYLEIDGLSQVLLRRALDEGHLPTLKRWIDQGTHKLIGWETDFSSQTGAMQSGILLGSNNEVPAYRWWDRAQHKLVMSGDPRDAIKLEARLSNGKGLCSDGGSSRGNMFSGDASESMLTFSTLINKKRGRGPGFYFYLFSPYVLARLITRFIIMVIKEWWQAYLQRWRKDKIIVSSRNFVYAFMRGFLGPILTDLVTYTLISDVLRGLPAVYALFSAYDDLAHFAGMDTPEALEELQETDHYFARVERALEQAPRPYKIVILSDHGQTKGATFKSAYGQSLDEIVKGLIKGDEVMGALDTNEAWDNLNAVLTESTSDDTRSSKLIKRALSSKEKDGTVYVGPERDPKLDQEIESKEKEAKVIVLGSGCTGLINFTEATERMTYEQIQDAYPDLILGLINHPGIGFLLVKSAELGDVVLTKGGSYFLQDDKVEGKNPLENYGPNAALHLRRETSFVNCPDILVNSVLDTETQECAGFENQASHHGGIGGLQNHPFILYPASFPYDGTPIIGAESVYKVLRGWRDLLQNPQ